MAGVYAGGQWIPFQDHMGRQGWYNNATGQTTYQQQTYGAAGYGAGALVPQQGQVAVQPQMYQQPVPVQTYSPYVAQPQMVPQMVAPAQMVPVTPVPQMAPQMQPMQQMTPQMQQQQQQQQMIPHGWQPMTDRSGRRYYYNPSTGQSVYQF